MPINSPVSLAVPYLQLQLANSIILFLNYEICGQQSALDDSAEIRSISKGLSSQMKSVYSQLCDRLTQLGQDPHRQIEFFVQHSTIKQCPNSTCLEDLCLLKASSPARAVREITEAILDLQAATDDIESIDCLMSILRVHRAHQSFLRQLTNSLDSVSQN